jgi:TPR repeat protein
VIKEAKELIIDATKYFFGTGEVERSLAKAYKILDKGIKYNNAPCLAFKAWTLMNGRGCVKDVKRAI